ncbi:uncharacterized protein LOC113360141 [Papaver somniferum]|uniref:uncharacterized protein LOC113360141 n=1 Tax=Papaver somniferum TaxID=3469 RepID=UPI000E70598D|nr:uncharacterized protein LOC113360141 [Papaver somniferum]
MAMGSRFGRPIRVDETTLKKEVGLYANILVEIDLTKVIPNEIWVETNYGKFEQAIRFNRIPKSCHHCNTIGHYVAECRIKRKEQVRKENPQHQWRYTPKKTQHQTSVGFDICFNIQQIVESVSKVDELVNNITPLNVSTEEKCSGFTGLLESTQEFPTLSVDKLLDVSTRIPPLTSNVGVTQPSLV